MSTIADLLEQYHKLAASSDSAKLDTELLLCYCIDKSRSYLRAWPEAEVDGVQLQQFYGLMDRRANGEPVAYLVGSQGFWSLELAVNNHTLIPRPETELLVEKSLELLASKTHAKILDLGTGTGAVALALATERPQWSIIASDCVPQAVLLAEQNRRAHALNNVSIVESNWFQSLSDNQQSFDLIVSNPPYIDPADPHLSQGDVRFEPQTALVADGQGLADIRHIVENARQFLAEGGLLLLEHGFDQANLVQQLLEENGYSAVFTEQDLNGNDRVSGGYGTLLTACYRDIGNE